jgi:hypothetical protein
MEPNTLENIAKGAGFIVGFSLAGYAMMFGTFVGFIKYHERKHVKDQLIPLYEKGEIKTKPTIFNVYKVLHAEGFKP